MTMQRRILTLFLTVFLLLPCISATIITLSNKCPHPVWPAILPNPGKPILARGGFLLPPRQARTLHFPPLWAGRLWARHGCTFDSAGRGRCATGDCGGALFCNGLGGTPPATLVELTLGADRDFYDVSLVDGYNLPISLTPMSGPKKCASAGCVRDLNAMCPVGLQVRSRQDGRVVACKSACRAFNSPKYCCTGSYASPQVCGPTAYSRIFKSACPKAYSYAYDDPSSLITCSKANYLVTFCPN